MATVSSVSVVRNERVQFQGLIQQVVIVEATVAAVTISGNANEDSTIPAVGIDHETDFVLGWTHSHAGTHAHEVNEEVHTWDDELHLVVHNRSGSPVDLPQTTYKFLVGRLA